MAMIVIIGDGPAGVSAAIFLARGGHEVTVLAQDSTAMHYAFLNNFYGAPATAGSELNRIGKSQAEAAGAVFDGRAAVSLSAERRVTLDDGEVVTADYVILAEGKSHPVADSAGITLAPDGAVAIDGEQRTSLPRVYAAGRSTRPGRSQAIISAGQGAIAALDILASEAGALVQDWDSVD